MPSREGGSSYVSKFLAHNHYRKEMMNTTAFRPLALTVVGLAWVALVFVAISLGSRAAEAQPHGCQGIPACPLLGLLPST